MNSDMKKILMLGASLLAVCALMNSCRKQPKVDPEMPSIVWEENGNFSTVEIVDGFTAPITVTAPKGIDVLTLTGNSIPTALLASANNLIGTGANKGDKPVFDLIDDAELGKSLSKLGFPTGSAQRGKSTPVKFDLAKLVSNIIGDNEVLVKNNDTFEFEIRLRDYNGNEVKKTARFHNTSAPELKAEPTEVELNTTSSVSSVVNIKAEGGLKGLTLTFETESAGIRNFVGKRSSALGLNPVVDLVNDEKAVTAFANLGLKTGKNLTGKDIKLELTQLMDQLKMEVDQTASSSHKITVTATDNNGKKGLAVVTLRFTK